MTLKIPSADSVEQLKVTGIYQVGGKLVHHHQFQQPSSVISSQDHVNESGLLISQRIVYADGAVFTRNCNPDGSRDPWKVEVPDVSECCQV